jgi:D-alanine-D-alanine ligase
METLPKSLRIGVLRGGPSSEYEVSLKTGAHVLTHLSEYNPIDIFISKDGIWHVGGIEKSPERILEHIDVIWNALQGEFGEDGGVQEILEKLNIPYTGSKKFESAIATNKWLVRERAKALGIKTPVSMLVRRTDKLAEKAKEIFSSLPHPLVVKPVSRGSQGIQNINSYNELLSALEEILSKHDAAIVEDYIVGKNASVGIVDNFRDTSIYTFLPIEVTVDSEIVPGNFSEKEKEEMQKVASIVHRSLGLRHFSHSDFVVSPKRGVYFMETNTSPKLTHRSHGPQVLDSMGVSIKEFLQHILKLAIYETGIWL